jgi:16S rRNA C967 or C1407 C5-methylase (RsmB/RsmF family)
LATEVSPKIYEYFSSIYGKESADKYLEFIETDPTQYIRVNTAKISKDDLSKLLFEKYQIKTQSINHFERVLKIIEGNDRIGKTFEHVLGFYYIE